jgi:phosphoadenosine phosphosulfate reductase
MTLIEHTLWGTRDKVQVAIDRLRSFEPPEGYYLAFSGGKDSITVHRLAELADVRFDAHYNVTTVDPPELTAFIRANYPGVEWHRPEMSMFRLIVHKRWPPMRQKRYCCERLKEHGGTGRRAVTGIRWEESYQRSTRRMVESCHADKTKVYINPILDWTEGDVWEFIRAEGLAYCSLYDEGFDRLGCILCPMETNPDAIQRHIERWPQFADAYVHTFDRVIALRKAEGRRCTFDTGRALFDWWIDRRPRPQQEQDERLFEMEAV